MITTNRRAAQAAIVNGSWKRRQLGVGIGELPTRPPTIQRDDTNQRVPGEDTLNLSGQDRAAWLSGQPPLLQRATARARSGAARRGAGAICRIAGERAFGDWLAGELGRPPVVGDLNTDVIAACARFQ